MAVSRLLVWAILPFLYSTTVHAFNGFGRDIDRYIQEASYRYHINEAMLRGLVKMEEGWYGNISPTGTIGVGQFTKETWNWLAQTDRGRAIGMRLITPSIQGTRADPRHHKRINTFATALLARWNIEQFQRRGIPITDENVYMAHNIGLDGFHRAILGKSTWEDIKNMRRNGMKRGMSVRQFIAYQKGRYNRHKNIANVIPSHQKQSATVWVKPQLQSQSLFKSTLPITGDQQNNINNTLIWVEPSDTNIIWADNAVNM